MGATLPVMQRLLAELQPERRWVSTLYAANTAGAMLGVVGSVWLILPTIGFKLFRQPPLRPRQLLQLTLRVRALENRQLRIR